MLIDVKKLKKFIFYFLSTVSSAVCCLCLAIQIFEISKKNLGLLEIFSLSFIMSDGDIRCAETKIDADSFNINEVVKLDVHKPSSASIPNFENSGIENASVQCCDYPDISDFSIPHDEGENTFKIIESHFGDSGLKYENFYVNNKSGIDLNIAEELSKKPDMDIKKDGSPQVLIYHTHTCESFMDKDQGFYFESFYPRTEDKRYSVVRVGDAICES